MEQLKVKDIVYMLKVLMKEKGLSMAELMELPIYLGDDDELNGIHCGWDFRIIDADDEEDAFCVEMINERCGNYPLSGNETAILIS